MSADTTLIGYTGVALPLAATTYTLFDTTVAFPAAGFMAMNQMKRLEVDLSVDQLGTFTWQKSNNRGVSWIQLSTQAVAVGSNQLDLLVEEYQDFRLQFLTGGTNEGVFSLNMALSGERVKST